MGHLVSPIMFLLFFSQVLSSSVPSSNVSVESSHRPSVGKGKYPFVQSFCAHVHQWLFYGTTGATVNAPLHTAILDAPCTIDRSHSDQSEAAMKGHPHRGRTTFGALTADRAHS